jgi:radical SAM-linked protein
MRIRIVFSKIANLRYTSILDVQKIWERAVRRAGFYLQYSQGFHPQAKIQAANPLPLGYDGLEELVDLWLTGDPSPDLIFQQLSKALPAGIAIKQIETVPENAPSLPKQVAFSDYCIRLHDPEQNIAGISERINTLLARKTLPRTRNGKDYDLRPLILAMTAEKSGNDSTMINLRMPSSSGKTGRPEEVMFELGFEWQDFQIIRTRLILGEPEP